MFLDPLTKMLPLLALGILGFATFLVALGALRSARRAEHLGEGRFELLRDQAERLELLREERKTLLEDSRRPGASSLAPHLWKPLWFSP